MMEKLVRDRIPELFGTPRDRYRRAGDEGGDFLNVLLDKLREETGELEADPSIEELVDVVEVAYAIASALEIDRDALERAREAKAAERGGFDERIVWIRDEGGKG